VLGKSAEMGGLDIDAVMLRRGERLVVSPKYT
jgi:hypothetical protein